MTQAFGISCEGCGLFAGPGPLMCPRCGSFIYRRALEHLATEALRHEPVNPSLAAYFWRQSLPMIPAGSPQFRQIVERAAALDGSSISVANAIQHPVTVRDDSAHRVRPPDELPMAVFKTLGSMLISVFVYALLSLLAPAPYIQSANDAIIFAVGLTSLLLVHELGHSIALRLYGLSASPPIFIPFLGAVINMRQPPRNAKEEAVIGIAGPLLGTVGAVLSAGLLLTPWAGPSSAHHEVVGTVVFIGIFLNLINLLPVPPLDGGRVTAAISPWIWLLGLAALLGLVWFWSTGYIMLALILATGLPRIVQTLRRRPDKNPYYAVKRRDVFLIAGLYLGLAAVLFAMIHALGEFNPLTQLT